MKYICTILLSFYSLLFPVSLVAQADAKHPCITSQEYKMIETQIAENSKRLGIPLNVQKRTTATSLSWPLRMANGLNDCSYYFVAAYVDQDTATGAFKDFNCGSNSYDGHTGTDIATWPYGFYKMDNSYVEVIAAAAGTIIQKNDGNFDRNCTKNNLTANSIIIQHADGSYALYWHMKKNSVTSMAVGQTVAAGEYLGAVGSSGSASGTHLHFEVWSDNTNATYKDPYSGTCNHLNASSWWASQKPYAETSVIKVSANTTDIVLPGCPTTETPNETSVFTIPFQGTGLPAGYAKFYFFLRNEVNGLVADCKILNPNQSTFASWTSSSTANNKTGIKGFSKVLPTIAGTYTFQCTYNGTTCSRNFDIVSTVGLPTMPSISQIQLYPNPASSLLTISGEGVKPDNYKFTIRNILGQAIYEDNTRTGHSLTKTFSIASFPNGIYFVTIETGKERVVKKFIKQ